MKLHSIRTFLPIILGISLGCVTHKLIARQEGSDGTITEPQYFPMAAIDGVSFPFSEAVKLGDTLYVSGQIGNLPGTLTLAPGGIEPEARRALENIKTILERHGSSMNNVVKCTIFLADINEWPAFNRVYREYFQKNLPARSALAASGLALGARVEVECVAFIPSKQ